MGNSWMGYEPKIKSELYYQKDDIENTKPYRVTGITHDFHDTDKSFVCFYELRNDEAKNLILPIDEFNKLFYLVVKEI